MVCRKFSPVILDGSDYFRYFIQGKDDVQTIFPYLDASQREVLITGIHPNCWTKLMGEEES
jgi:hypothetical protein